jgi:hypothetical protein
MPDAISYLLTTVIVADRIWHANPDCNALAAALDMEDQISRGVYEDYRKRENWPSGLDEAAFRQIQERLSILIEDTKRHFKTLRALIDEHGQSRQS